MELSITSRIVIQIMELSITSRIVIQIMELSITSRIVIQIMELSITSRIVIQIMELSITSRIVIQIMELSITSRIVIQIMELSITSRIVIQIMELSITSRIVIQIMELSITSRIVIQIMECNSTPDYIFGEKGDIQVDSEKRGVYSIDLDTTVGNAPIPSYLRFLYINLYDTFFTPFFIDQLTRLENAFDSGELVFLLPYGPCKNEHELRLQTFKIIEKVTPVFHKVRDIRLFWCDGPYKILPMGPMDDINILSTPLLLNCRSLLLYLKREYFHRLGLISPDQKVESKNERRCEVVVENRDRNYCEEGAPYPDPFDLISERAKSMTNNHSDVVVEFPNGSPTRIYKYPRRIADN
ncbi:hypothetical protein Ddc_20511 [Ditylenchus destructor]|nr:hypothetical protein Ddc_20511 [Ditylenchus destructor]